MLRSAVLLVAPISALSVCPDGGPPRSWRLAYIYHGDIWTAKDDGSAKKLLVNNGRSPCWSTDRKWIAYEGGFRKKKHGIYVEVDRLLISDGEEPAC